MRKCALLGWFVGGMKQVWIWALAAEYFVLMKIQALFPVGRLRFIIVGRAFLIGMAAVELGKGKREKRC